MKGSTDAYEIARNHAESLGMSDKIEWHRVGAYLVEEQEKPVSVNVVSPDYVGMEKPHYQIRVTRDWQAGAVEKAIETIYGKFMSEGND